MSAQLRALAHIPSVTPTSSDQPNQPQQPISSIQNTAELSSTATWRLETHYRVSDMIITQLPPPPNSDTTYCAHEFPSLGLLFPVSGAARPGARRALCVNRSRKSGRYSGLRSLTNKNAHSLPLLLCLYFTDPFRIPAKPLNRHLLSRM